jgi:hypothetical protein
MRSRTTCVAIASCWALAIFFGWISDAHADAKVRKLIKFYNKEATVCAKYTAGLASAKDRAEPYMDDAEIAADVGHLRDALAIVQDYCDAIDATLAILDPDATYKSLQAEIARHDSVVRTGRAAAKQALDDTAPVIQRLVPKVNKRRASS